MRGGRNESFRPSETWFGALVAKLKLRGEDILVFKPLLAIQLLNAAHVGGNKWARILAVCVVSVKAEKDIDSPTITLFSFWIYVTRILQVFCANVIFATPFDRFVRQLLTLARAAKVAEISAKAGIDAEFRNALKTLSAIHIGIVGDAPKSRLLIQSRETVPSV